MSKKQQLDISTGFEFEKNTSMLFKGNFLFDHNIVLVVKWTSSAINENVDCQTIVKLIIHDRLYWSSVPRFVLSIIHMLLTNKKCTQSKIKDD